MANATFKFKRRAKDLVGLRFGKLLVIERDFSKNSKGAYWKCVCDCGKTTVVIATHLKRGNTKSCGCMQGCYLGGASHPFWKGGRITHSGGYIMIYSPSHPGATKSGYIFEHRLVMEKYMGRRLSSEETVHHVNGNKKDNRLDNLELWASSQPKGQRTEDLVKWAEDILLRYKPQALSSGGLYNG